MLGTCGTKHQRQLADHSAAPVVGITIHLPRPHRVLLLLKLLRGRVDDRHEVRRLVQSLDAVAREAVRSACIPVLLRSLMAR